MAEGVCAGFALDFVPFASFVSFVSCAPLVSFAVLGAGETEAGVLGEGLGLMRTGRESRAARNWMRKLSQSG